MGAWDMATPFDSFLATQGRMRANEAQGLENQMTLAKLGQIERAQKMQDDTLLALKNQQAPKSLQELGKDAPDAASERGEPTPPPKQKSAGEQVMMAADEADRLAKTLQSINPAEAEKQRRERDNLWLKAAPLLKEERLAKIEEGNIVNQWMGAVKDDMTLNAVMGQIKQQKPDLYKAWTEMRLPNGAPAFQQNLDGSFAYTPQTQKIAEAVSNASMKRSEQLSAEDKVADNKQKELEFEQKKKMDADLMQHRRATEAAAREGGAKQRAPIGFRYTPEGDLEPIPGGPKDPNNQTVGTKDVQQLSKAFEAAKLPVASKVLSNAEKFVADDPKVLEYATGPGMAFPDRAIPENARLARQAIQKVFNIELKDRSGAAVTSQELDRLKQEYGQGLFKTPEQLAAALKQAREVITDHYRSVGAGFGPKVLQAYNDNLKAIGGTPLDLAPKAVQYTETRTLPDGRVLGKKADGTVVIVK